MFLGAVYYLNKYRTDFKLENIKCFHGSSAGSILASCLALGISPENILEESLSVDFKTLIQQEFDDKNLESIEKYFSFDFDGLINGTYFLEQLSTAFKNHCEFWFDELTFEDLKNKTENKLIITATNITDRKSQDFSFENTPHLPILLAIRMSCGIPFIFKPYVFQQNEYVDGDLFEKTSETIADFLHGKDFVRFVCLNLKQQPIIGGGFFCLLSKVLFSRKPKLNLEKSRHKNVEYINLETNSFFLNFNSTIISEFYLEGINQVKKNLINKKCH